MKDKRGVLLEVGQKVRVQYQGRSTYWYGTVWEFERFPGERQLVLVLDQHSQDDERGIIPVEPTDVEVLSAAGISDDPVSPADQGES